MIFSHFCHLWCSGPNQAAHRNVYWWRPKRWKPCHFCHNPLANMLPRPVSGLLSRRANAMGHDPKSSDLKSEFLCSLQLRSSLRRQNCDNTSITRANVTQERGTPKLTHPYQEFRSVAPLAHLHSMSTKQKSCWHVPEVAAIQTWIELLH